MPQEKVGNNNKTEITREIQARVFPFRLVLFITLRLIIDKIKATKLVKKAKKIPKRVATGNSG